jgi:hypothetical protein
MAALVLIEYVCLCAIHPLAMPVRVGAHAGWVGTSLCLLQLARVSANLAPARLQQLLYRDPDPAPPS